MADSTSSGINWMACTSGMIEERLHEIWDWKLDEEEQPRPLLHQKRVKGLRYDSVKPPKGIGFVRMFKGFRYPIGRKNL